MLLYFRPTQPDKRVEFRYSLLPRCKMADRYHGATQVDMMDTTSHAVAISMTDYHLAKQIKMPDNVPASAGGLNKSSNIT